MRRRLAAGCASILRFGGNPFVDHEARQVGQAGGDAGFAAGGVFKCGREFAAWLGLTPRQNSSGGKDRLGRITRKGNQHVRRLLIIGAHAALLNSRVLKTTDWVQGLMQRRPRQVVAVALANKMARIAWALMARGTSYRVAVAA